MGVLLIGALLVRGCATSTSDRAPTNTGATGPDPRLDFTATTVEGQTFDGQELAGKPGVLWFWAPWCPTCHAQTPSVSRLAETYRNRVNSWVWAAWTKTAQSGTMPTASATRSLC